MNRKLILLLILFLSLSLAHAMTLTQKNEIPDTLYIGIPFYIHLSLPQGTDSLNVVIPDSLPNFQILEQKRSTEKGKNEFIIKAAAFEVGNLQFPALKIEVYKKTTADSAAIIPFNLTVRSVLPPKGEPKLKDIADALNVPWTIWNYIVILLALVLIAGITYLIIHYLHFRKKQIIPIGKPVDSRPAWQIALDELVLLQSQRLLDKGEFLDYHFGLSMILRRFIENYAGFNAVEMTTSEIHDILSSNDYTWKAGIVEYLQEADRVKFAKHIPTPGDSEEAYRWLYQYLQSFSQIEKPVEKETPNA